MTKARETLYVGTGRYVAALDAQTGEERWRTKLMSSTSYVVTLLLKGKRLYVGHAGRAYCLDTNTGAILWENGLPKTGFGAVLMAMEGAQDFSAPGALAQIAAEAAAAASASAAT